LRRFSLLYPGRIFLGVGSGEAPNEQAGTGSWPKSRGRSEPLVDAADIIHRLWADEQVVHHGKYYNVNAKLYDPPAANGKHVLPRVHAELKEA
jgi:alkanesulfonate monooxygenase SsuD/methylene tetrahydromethanopterin reductase-like flavin-dependent oxidoreductase (luciferase family)